jgi:hypothetical protein
LLAAYGSQQGVLAALAFGVFCYAFFATRAEGDKKPSACEANAAKQKKKATKATPLIKRRANQDPFCFFCFASRIACLATHLCGGVAKQAMNCFVLYRATLHRRLACFASGLLRFAGLLRKKRSKPEAFYRLRRA